MTLLSLKVSGHRPDDPDSRDNFEARISPDRRSLSVREDLLSAIRLLGQHQNSFLHVWSYLSFPSSVALALENGWSTAGVQAATKKLMEVAAQVLSPEDITELIGPVPEHNSSGVAIDPKDHTLPQWPRWGENS